MDLMRPEGRTYLWGAAQAIDQRNPFRSFRQEFADANAANVTQKQADIDRKKKKSDEQTARVQAFEPVLDLASWTIDDNHVPRMKGQLQWHRDVVAHGNILIRKHW